MKLGVLYHHFFKDLVSGGCLKWWPWRKSHEVQNNLYRLDLYRKAEEEEDGTIARPVFSPPQFFFRHLKSARGSFGVDIVLRFPNIFSRTLFLHRNT